MGGSSSKAENVTEMVSSVMMSQLSSIVQNTLTNSSENQKLIINARGNIVIENNRFTQTTQINELNVLKAASTQDSQQKIVNQITQLAKATVSGISFDESTDASNKVSDFVSAVTNQTALISQTCNSVASQNQEIDIGGDSTELSADCIKDAADCILPNDITISGNTFDQGSSLVQQCFSNAVSNQKAVQDVQQIVDQKAEATTKGVSMAAIILAMIIGLLAIFAPEIIGVGVAVNAILKLIFPLFVLIGLLLLARNKQTTVSKVYLFSRGLDIQGGEACEADYLKAGGREANIQKGVSNPRDAQKIFESEKDTIGIDWVGYDVDEIGGGYKWLKEEDRYIVRYKHAVECGQSVPMDTTSCSQANGCIDLITRPTLIKQTIWKKMDDLRKFNPTDTKYKDPNGSSPIPSFITLFEGKLYSITNTSTYNTQTGYWGLLNKGAIPGWSSEAGGDIYDGPPTGDPGPTDKLKSWIDTSNPVLIQIWQPLAKKGSSTNFEWVINDTTIPNKNGYTNATPEFANFSAVKINTANKTTRQLGYMLLGIGVAGLIGTNKYSTRKKKNVLTKTSYKV